MFVASYASFRAVPGSILASTFKFSLATHWGFAVTIKLWVGSGPSTTMRGIFFCTSRGAMCAGSAQVTFAKLRRSYNAGRNPKGENNTRNQKNNTEPTTAMRGTTSVPLHHGSGPSLQCAVSFLFGCLVGFVRWCLALMLGSYLLSVPIQFNQGDLCLSAHIAPPPVQKKHYNARYCLGTARALYYNARQGLGTARALHYNARTALPLGPLHYNARRRLGTASVPLGPFFQCAVPTPRLRFTTFQLDRSEEPHKDHHETQP